MPEMKDLVPSIGSSTQTYSASVRSLPYSSPTMPCSGKLLRIKVRIAASAERSAAVTGSKLPPRLLFSTLSEVRKNGRIASPAAAASLSTKAAKSMAVMRPHLCAVFFQLSCAARRSHRLGLDLRTKLPVRARACREGRRDDDAT